MLHVGRSGLNGCIKVKHLFSFCRLVKLLSMQINDSPGYKILQDILLRDNFTHLHQR